MRVADLTDKKFIGTVGTVPRYWNKYDSSLGAGHLIFEQLEIN